MSNAPNAGRPACLLAGGTSQQSRDARGMTAAVPCSRLPPRQGFPHRLLTDAQRRPHGPQAHPELPHSSRLGGDFAILEGVPREDGELELDLRHGSNW